MCMNGSVTQRSASMLLYVCGLCKNKCNNNRIIHKVPVHLFMTIPLFYSWTVEHFRIFHLISSLAILSKLRRNECTNRIRKHVGLKMLCIEHTHTHTDKRTNRMEYHRKYERMKRYPYRNGIRNMTIIDEKYWKWVELSIFFCLNVKKWSGDSQNIAIFFVCNVKQSTHNAIQITVLCNACERAQFTMRPSWRRRCETATFCYNFSSLSIMVYVRSTNSMSYLVLFTVYICVSVWLLHFCSCCCDLWLWLFVTFTMFVYCHLLKSCVLLQWKGKRK